jgi:hypothetical protein
MRFDLPLPFAHEILQLSARGREGVRNSDLYVLVSSGGSRIPAYRNIRAARDREVEMDSIDVTLMVTMLRPTDDDARRCDAVVELLELLGFVAHASVNVINWLDMLEDNLDRKLHCYSSIFALAETRRSGLLGSDIDLARRTRISAGLGDTD